MNFQFEKSLNSIDKKVNINFLNNKNKLDKKINDNIHSIGNQRIIWELNNFLNDNECDEIIKNSEETGFESLENQYDKNFRDSKRILSFDNNGNLIKTIEERLLENNFIEKLNMLYWQEPYGFINNVKMTHNSNRINNLLRINKYEPNGTGFKWHRDSQLTSGLMRSNYTIIIYLTSNEGGETMFLKPKDDIIENGLSMDETLEQYGELSYIKIKPKKGTAIIFDQSLIHCGNTVLDKTKYVLRTDLMCEFEIIDKEIKKNKLEELTKKLFKQAQYYELNGDKRAKELYERCISLRLKPNMIKNYPEHLEKLLEPISIEKEINNITILNRTGEKYVFKYDSDDCLIDNIKLAAIITITTINIDLNDLDNIEKINKNYFDLLKFNDLHPKNKIKKNYLDIFKFNKKYKEKVKEEIKKIEEYDSRDEYFSETLKYEKVDCLNKLYYPIQFRYSEYNNDLEYDQDDYYNEIDEINYNIEFDNEEPNNNEEPSNNNAFIKIEKEKVELVKEGCGLCSPIDNYNSAKIMIDDFDININENVIGYVNVNNKNETDDIINGTIDLICNSKYFNHASCQCSEYVIADTISDDSTISNLQMNFELDKIKKEITIEFSLEIML